MTRSQRKNSRGFSLIEMITVITLTTFLIALAVGSINVLMKVEQSGRRRTVEAGTADMFARAFRSDVRAAHKVDQADEELHPDLTLTRPDGVTVVYHAEPGEVKRSELKDGKETRKMNFRMPKRSAAGFQVVKDHGLTVIGLVYDRESAPNSEAHSSSFRSEAVLGRDHRFTHVGEAK